MKKSLIPIALFAMLFACQNNSKQPSQQAATTVEKQDTISHHEEEAGEQSNPVILNNGKKWDANKETTAGIKKMTALTAALPAKPKLENYHSLKEGMENEFNQILQKCTMTGEAHTQLHNYLLPMKDMMENLNSQDMAVCEKALGELKLHLNEYGNYFQ